MSTVTVKTNPEPDTTPNQTIPASQGEAALTVEAVTTAAEAAATAEVVENKVEEIAQETEQEISAIAQEVERIESWQNNLTETMNHLMTAQAQQAEVLQEMRAEMQAMREMLPIQSQQSASAEGTSGIAIVPDVLPADPLNPTPENPEASAPPPENPPPNRKAQKVWI